MRQDSNTERKSSNPFSLDSLDLSMDEQQRRNYVIPRKLHREQAIHEEQIRRLEQVIIHNAYTGQEIKEDFTRLNLKPKAYFPELSKEQHFWDGSAIHLVNPRGKIRLNRDIDQVRVLREITSRDIGLTINHKRGDEYHADLEFTKMAFGVAEEAIKLLLDHQKEYQSFINIIMGPHSYAPMRDIISSNNNEYLSFRILNLDDNIALHFNDPFGDQAHDVLSQLYKAIDTYYKGTPINLFHYGKVGALAEGSKVGDFFLPTMTISEQSILSDNRFNISFDNGWTSDPEAKRILEHSIEKQAKDKSMYTGATINSTSVLQQTISNFDRLKRFKPVCIDMELEEILKTSPNYSNEVRIFSSYVSSDKPPEITLAENRPIDAEQKLLFEAIVEYIRKG